MKDRLCVGVVGSGIISEIYIRNMTTRFPNLWVKAVASKHLDHAKKRAAEFGLSAATVEELFADPEIDLIVNLTPVGAHYEIVKAALLAGKHVYSEKTLTDSPETAAELLKLAGEKGLYLGAAPDTFLGAGIQAARGVIDSGRIGKVTGFAVTANRNWEALMNWFPFLQEKGAGMCYDFAVYHLTAVLSMLGPVSEVAAFAVQPGPYRHLIPDAPDYGKPYICPNETQVSAILKLQSGVTGTLMMDGDCITKESPVLRIYGTNGILEFGDPNKFGEPVRVMLEEKDWRTEAFADVPLTSEYADNSRGLGVSEMAAAILSGTKSRVDAHLACHVLDVLSAMLQSSAENRFVKVCSTFDLPLPM